MDGGLWLLREAQAVVPGQGGDTAVISGFPLFGEEAAGDLALLPVVGNAGAALAAAGTVVSTGAGVLVVTGHSESLRF